MGDEWLVNNSLEVFALHDFGAKRLIFPLVTLSYLFLAESKWLTRKVKTK